MSSRKSTARIALAAVITLIAGVSDAFVAPSVSSVKIDARGSNTRAGSSSCLSMSADGGTTRGDFGKQTIATLLAGVTAAANFEAAGAANKLQISSTASGSRVNKDPISLLQWGLPIDCKPARQLQESVEATKVDLFQKNWSRAVSDCARAKSAISTNKAAILKAVGSTNEASATKLLADLDLGLGALQRIVQDAGAGVVLEKAKLDEAYPVHADIVSNVGQLEALMVPADYPKKLEANIPADFADLPRLLGRSTVEFVIEKPKGAKFDVGGVLYDKVRLTMVLDGYTAPVTAGTIVDLIQRGYYNNMPITRSDGFVVQTGDPDPEGKIHDFFPAGSDTPRKIPLEIAVTEDKLPMYSVTTEDDGRGYAATKLPFQAYGALGMARSEFEADSASCQFFWLLFDSDLTPAGKNLLDGRYAQFGYTVDNEDLLADVKEGDIIKSAKVRAESVELKVVLDERRTQLSDLRRHLEKARRAAAVAASERAEQPTTMWSSWNPSTRRMWPLTEGAMDGKAGSNVAIRPERLRSTTVTDLVTTGESSTSCREVVFVFVRDFVSGEESIGEELQRPVGARSLDGRRAG